jgi:hypothetical protein
MCGKAVECCAWSRIPVWHMQSVPMHCCDATATKLTSIFAPFTLYSISQMFQIIHIKYFPFVGTCFVMNMSDCFFNVVLFKLNAPLKYYNSAESICLYANLKILYVFVVTLPCFTSILMHTHFILSAISQCHADTFENSVHYTSLCEYFLRLPVKCKTLL